MGGMDPSASAGGAGGAKGAGSGGDPNSLTGADALGATTQSVSNSDGSTTTTITYADGSKVSTTSSPAGASQSSPSNSHKGNFLEQLIQIQAQSIKPTTSTTPTV